MARCYPGPEPAAHFLGSLDLRGTTFKGHVYPRVGGRLGPAGGPGRRLRRHHADLARDAGPRQARPHRARGDELRRPTTSGSSSPAATSRGRFPPSGRRPLKNRSETQYQRLPRPVLRHLAARAGPAAQLLGGAGRRRAGRTLGRGGRRRQRVTVVTVPPRGADRAELWRRFAQATDLPEIDYAFPAQRQPVARRRGGRAAAPAQPAAQGHPRLAALRRASSSGGWPSPSSARSTRTARSPSRAPPGTTWPRSPRLSRLPRKSGVAVVGDLPDLEPAVDEDGARQPGDLTDGRAARCRARGHRNARDRSDPAETGGRAPGHAADGRPGDAGRQGPHPARTAGPAPRQALSGRRTVGFERPAAAPPRAPRTADWRPAQACRGNRRRAPRTARRLAAAMAREAVSTRACVDVGASNVASSRRFCSRSLQARPSSAVAALIATGPRSASRQTRRRDVVAAGSTGIRSSRSPSTGYPAAASSSISARDRVRAQALPLRRQRQPWSRRPEHLLGEEEPDQRVVAARRRASSPSGSSAGPARSPSPPSTRSPVSPPCRSRRVEPADGAEPGPQASRGPPGWGTVRTCIRPSADHLGPGGSTAPGRAGPRTAGRTARERRARARPGRRRTVSSVTVCLCLTCSCQSDTSWRARSRAEKTTCSSAGASSATAGTPSGQARPPRAARWRG